MAKIDELKFDDKNFNKHTEYGMSLLEKSLRENGAGRSILIDKDNNIIAGNGIVEAAGSVGLENIKIVETTGDEIVAVKRTDIALDSEQGRKMALADNATAAADLEWDFDRLSESFNDEYLESWGIDTPAPKLYEDGALGREFIVPPFTVLDTRTPAWLQRKRVWQTIIKGSELGRDKNLLRFSDSKVMTKGGYTSIFDPVLCEIIYRWFGKKKGTILDPFAGGSVRGIVAGALGLEYHGNDLSKKQIDEDIEQAKAASEIYGDGFVMPKYTIGDSLNIDKLCNGQYDMIMSCPPYADLEVYSDDPNDLSNMDYDKFIQIYREIIRKSVSMLKENSFAVFVVGEVRDKNGEYRNFVGDTIKAFQDAGLRYYNHAILVNRNGSAAVRARGNMQYKKLVHTHQDVIVGSKGDAESNERIDPLFLADWFNENAQLFDQHEEIAIFSNAADFKDLKKEYQEKGII